MVQFKIYDMPLFIYLFQTENMMMDKSLLLVVFLSIAVSANDILQHKVDFADCTEVTSEPDKDCRWYANFNRRVDEMILNGTIVAYQISFSGSWSNWIVPGQNDIDKRVNVISDGKCAIPVIKNSIRRRWSYFSDHVHKYIICK